MIKRSCLCAALMLALAGTAPVLAQVETRHAIEVPAQDLGTALRLLAQQTRLQIVYSADLVQGKRAPALDGSLTAREALDRLLAGTGLGYEFLDAQTVTLAPASSPGMDVRGAPSGAPAPDIDSDATAARADAAPPVPDAQDRSQDLETVVVTGTRIRGGATPSPVITIGSERIREEGFSDLGEAMRSLPQNFSGGQNPGAGSGNIAGAGDANQNLTGGSGLNLRGLGPDATLTLLNGRRMAYSGYVQAVDIGAIPVEAVERIEIVADGASAIYGSDAVGGVANVILKREFDGVSLGTLYGRATDGGLTTREHTLTAGATWAQGGLIATYKDASVDPIYAADRDYTDHLPVPATLYPGSDQRSALVSAYQAIGERIELRLDALRTDRDVLQYYNSAGLNFRSSPNVKTTLVSPGVAFSLPNDWTLSLAGTRGEDELILDTAYTVMATGVSTRSEHACICNQSTAYEVGAEGPMFALPGGDARLAVGVGYRRNDFFWKSYLPGAGRFDIERVDESARFAYAEVSLPLVAPAQERAGVHRLLLTAAVRSEDYDSFGTTSTPKLGLIYSPSADLSIKASWGKSFKAPTLMQQHYPVNAYLYPPQVLGGSGLPTGATALVLHGGNPDLDPERATTWNASLAFHPEHLPGLHAELTWFDIDYSDRVMQPIANAAQAFSNPDYAPFLELAPTPEAQRQAIASADAFQNYTGVAYDPASVFAIVNMQFTNVARQRIRGLDLSGSYRFDLAAGTLTLRGAAAWLDSTQQVAPTLAPRDLAGTLFNPPRLSSRLGATFNQGGFSAAAFANYRGGVRNRMDDTKSGSFTTLDATLRYLFDERSDVWSNLELALSINNLLDRAPPLYSHATVAAAQNVPPFDQTNYSAIGRYLSVSVVKRW